MPLTSATSCSCEMGRVSGCLIMEVTEGSSSSAGAWSLDLLLVGRRRGGLEDGWLVGWGPGVALVNGGGSPSVHSRPFPRAGGRLGKSEESSSGRLLDRLVGDGDRSWLLALMDVVGDLKRFRSCRSSSSAASGCWSSGLSMGGSSSAWGCAWPAGVWVSLRES